MLYIQPAGTQCGCGAPLSGAPGAEEQEEVNPLPDGLPHPADP